MPLIALMTADKINLQRDNLQLLIDASGSLNKLRRVTEIPLTRLSKVKQGEGMLRHEEARQLEERLGLPSGWFDTKQGGEAETTLREHFQATGVGSVADNSVERQEIRRGNLRLLVGEERGAKTALCDKLEVPGSEFAAFMTRILGGQRARSIERKLGIPEGWLDEPHEGLELPKAFEDRLAALAVSVPAAAKRAISAITLTAAAPPKCAGGPIARALLDTLNDTLETGELDECDALELLNRVHALRVKRARR